MRSGRVASRFVLGFVKSESGIVEVVGGEFWDFVPVLVVFLHEDVSVVASGDAVRGGVHGEPPVGRSGVHLGIDDDVGAKAFGVGSLPFARRASDARGLPRQLNARVGGPAHPVVRLDDALLGGRSIHPHFHVMHGIDGEMEVPCEPDVALGCTDVPVCEMRRDPTLGKARQGFENNLPRSILRNGVLLNLQRRKVHALHVLDVAEVPGCHLHGLGGRDCQIRNGGGAFLDFPLELGVDLANLISQQHDGGSRVGDADAAHALDHVPMACVAALLAGALSLGCRCRGSSCRSCVGCRGCHLVGIVFLQQSTQPPPASALRALLAAACSAGLRRRTAGPGSSGGGCAHSLQGCSHGLRCRCCCCGAGSRWRGIRGRPGRGGGLIAVAVAAAVAIGALVIIIIIMVVVVVALVGIHSGSGARHLHLFNIVLVQPELCQILQDVRQRLRLEVVLQAARHDGAFVVAPGLCQRAGGHRQQPQREASSQHHDRCCLRSGARVESGTAMPLRLLVVARLSSFSISPTQPSPIQPNPMQLNSIQFYQCETLLPLLPPIDRSIVHSMHRCWFV
mmetsp:Transcript_19857/g.56187  ORF Transcript_19857/g.56187 Transcript_19857/m.56187 type:complete len:565 (-) Transcript_19857:56-1750(-)